MKKVIIFGGSGFLGLNLAKALLEREYEVHVVSRNKPKENGAWKFTVWDAQSLGEWCELLEGAEAIVNLVGRSVDCIKTPENIDEILRSRVDSVLLIGQALKSVKIQPKTWIQMSTAHRYGDAVDIVCNEESSFGYGLAPYVGEKWEEAYLESVPKEMRQVIVRTSFVLGKRGGALARMASLAKFGLGGTLGHGRQGISWIHEEDMNKLLIETIENERMHGAYIATAPNPVSNKVFMKKLRQSIKMPIGLPAFSWMVKLAAPLVMKTDAELALYGRYCVSKRLEEEGFEFIYPTVDDAFSNIYVK
jgi:uncharacterized protein (TIGR01777 family)